MSVLASQLGKQGYKTMGNKIDVDELQHAKVWAEGLLCSGQASFQLQPFLVLILLSTKSSPLADTWKQFHIGRFLTCLKCGFSYPLSTKHSRMVAEQLYLESK